jgi:hypothetical protein
MHLVVVLALLALSSLPQCAAVCTGTTIESVTPLQGSPGTRVTILGCGFTGTTAVQLGLNGTTFNPAGGSAQSFTVVNSTCILAISSSFIHRAPPRQYCGGVNLFVGSALTTRFNTSLWCYSASRTFLLLPRRNRRMH